MSSAVEEFSNTLQSFLSIKPPGVSGSKIRKLSELAVNNVQVYMNLSLLFLACLRVCVNFTNGFNPSLNQFLFKRFILILERRPRLIS